MQSKWLPTDVSQGLNNLRSDFQVGHHSSLLIPHDLYFPSLLLCQPFGLFAVPLHLAQKLMLKYAISICSFQILHQPHWPTRMASLHILGFSGQQKEAFFPKSQPKEAEPAVGRGGPKSLRTPGLHVLSLCCPVPVLNQMACLFSDWPPSSFEGH